jgi:gamma-glutamyltranspeptidase
MIPKVVSRALHNVIIIHQNIQEIITAPRPRAIIQRKKEKEEKSKGSPAKDKCRILVNAIANVKTVTFRGFFCALRYLVISLCEIM